MADPVPAADHGLVLVTGASSGIGAALARGLAARGASLALVGRDRQRTERVASLCRASGARAEAFLCDLAEGDERVRALVDDVRLRFGRPVDTLVHAAGRRAVGLVEDVPAEAVRDCFAVNLFAAFSLAAALLPEMKRRGSGHLVFLTSGTAFHGVPSESSYSASKAGLERLAEALRLEAGGRGVAVTLVSPGLVETPMVRNSAVFGSAPSVPLPAEAADPDAVAAGVLSRLSGRPERIELSWRPRLVRWLSRAAPGVLAWRIRSALRSS